MIEGSLILTAILGLALIALNIAVLVGFFTMVTSMRKIADNTYDIADMTQNMANELADIRRRRGDTTEAGWSAPARRGRGDVHDPP